MLDIYRWTKVLTFMCFLPVVWYLFFSVFCHEPYGFACSFFGTGFDRIYIGYFGGLLWKFSLCGAGIGVFALLNGRDAALMTTLFVVHALELFVIRKFFGGIMDVF